MRILLVGAGVVGFSLAEQLSREGHDIVILEKNEETLSEIQERLDALAICGSADDVDDLKKAKIDKSDMVVAVTDNDSLNILVCQMANKFNVPTKIARVRSQGLAGKGSPLKASELGIDRLITPEHVTIENITSFLALPGATEFAEFAGGDVLLSGFYLDESCPLNGTELKKLREDEAPFLFVAIDRNHKIIIPKGNEILQAGDHVFVIVKRDYIRNFIPIINSKYVDEEIRKIVILSASPLAVNLAEEIEKNFEKVVLIENDLEMAEKAASSLKQAKVVHGEVTEEEILDAVGMDSANFFIALSDDDETNILSCMVAKKNGAHHVINLQRTDKYESLLHYLDIDITLNPKHLTTGEILKYIRKGRIHSVTKLHESEAEVIELEAFKHAPIVDKPLHKVKLPKGCLIGAIMRNGNMIIPTGNSIIGSGETVIVFALPGAIKKVEKLFGS